MQFYKYQGTGNDFVMVDNRTGNIQLSTAEIARLCHRRFGIGADGLILLETHPEADFRMVYFNSDGNESTMCGNGGRCIAAFARDLGLVQGQCTFIAIDGPHEAVFQQDTVALRMGEPQGFVQQPLGTDISHSWVNTGSPHYIEFTTEPVENTNVYQKGKSVRYHAHFEAINGTNANFVQITGPDSLHVRTYERGVEDETLSCGTGVTASAYAYRALTPGAGNEISVQTPGGQLVVRFDTDDPRPWLIGPAVQVFAGTIG